MEPESECLKLIHVIAVAYQRYGELKIFVQSWINQTQANWKLTVIHDGYDEKFIKIMGDFRNICPDKIDFKCTETRYNDWGHSLREIGLKEAEGDYVLLTNADNYYIPKAVELINDSLRKAGNDADVVIFNMIHSHSRPGGRNLPSYSFFDVIYKKRSIDMGAAVVSTELAVAAGFKSRTHSADGDYFREVSRIKRDSGKELRIIKIPSVLFVHN
ncbi:glycosyl transferase family 2 [Rhodovulum imhoffii]|uniref:Glycosyl transferase family 2 n=1 Tax=Rhodovulum imhoffii TaxID=365340 RepID=A0A2T5BL63_9RHOB|nr:glycosyltransferase family A protein [Rhodovulum imhoffii]PTM99688.1 glycosyl transferase family 2 [Rhodovulum imhoffii]